MAVVDNAKISVNVITSANNWRRLCNCSFCLSVSLWAGLLMSQFVETWVLWIPIKRTDSTFDEATIPDMDSGSLFYFPHHCGIWDFKKSLAFFIQSPPDFYETWWNDWRWRDNPEYVGRDMADIRSRISINPAIRIRIPDYFWLKRWRWRRFSLSEYSLVCIIWHYQLRNCTLAVMCVLFTKGLQVFALSQHCHRF